MNEYDRTNLFFLLNSEPEALKEWYNSVGPDDHDYASELMSIYSAELEIATCLIDDREIVNVDVAAELINQFTLGNRH